MMTGEGLVSLHDQLCNEPHTRHSPRKRRKKSFGLKAVFEIEAILMDSLIGYGGVCLSEDLQ